MTFKISRTSQWHFLKDNPPCKNAVIGNEDYEYVTSILDENGKRITQTSTRTKNIWTIEINTLEDLMALKREVNENDNKIQVGLIIFDDDVMPEIEIYDTYRE